MLHSTLSNVFVKLFSERVTPQIIFQLERVISYYDASCMTFLFFLLSVSVCYFQSNQTATPNRSKVMPI